MKRYRTLDHLYAEKDVEDLSEGIRALREHRDTLMTWAWLTGADAGAKRAYVADARDANHAVVRLMRLRTRIMYRLIEEDLN